MTIGALAVFAFLALSHGRPGLAGAVFGLAQGARLLPGPLLVMPALVFAHSGRTRRRLALAYLVTSALTIGPALVADPAALMSATVLFYASYHAIGDDTSMWLHLSPWLRTPFLPTGLVLAVALAVSGALTTRSRRPRTPDLASAVASAYVAWLAFVAFNRMTHLNHLWAVHPLGSVAIATLALGSREVEGQDRAERAA